MTTIIDAQSRGLKVVRRIEPSANQHRRTVGELAADAIETIKAADAEAQSAREADRFVIELHAQLSALADRAIFIGRNFNRQSQVNHIMLAMANKVANALK